MKKTAIKIGFICTIFMVNLNASIINKIDNNLKQYKWFKNFQSYVVKITTSNHVSYTSRSIIASYLENIGLYQAEDTEYCKDIDDNSHSKKVNTCYIGKSYQNKSLLKSLQTSKVKKHLSSVTVSEIVNGENDIFLKNMKKFADKFCKDDKQCTFYDRVSAMESLK